MTTVYVRQYCYLEKIILDKVDSETLKILKIKAESIRDKVTFVTKTCCNHKKEYCMYTRVSTCFCTGCTIIRWAHAVFYCIALTADIIRNV